MKLYGIQFGVSVEILKITWNTKYVILYKKKKKKKKKKSHNEALWCFLLYTLPIIHSAMVGLDQNYFYCTEGLSR